MGLIQYMAATTPCSSSCPCEQETGNTAHLTETLVKWEVKDRYKWTEIKPFLPKCHFISWSPYREFVKIRKSIFHSASLSQVSLTHTFNTFPHKRAAHLFPSWSLCLTLWGIHGKRVIWTIKSSLTEQVGGRYASKVTGHWRLGHIISPGAVHAICTINNNIQNHSGKLLVWDSSRVCNNKHLKQLNDSLYNIEKVPVQSESSRITIRTYEKLKILNEIEFFFVVTGGWAPL